MKGLSEFTQFIVNGAIRENRASAEQETTRFNFGSHFQRERIAAAAAFSAEHFSGDFVEIGCFRGGTSQVLCQVAKKYSRKLICVDPWEVGTQNCDGDEYDAFLEATKEYRDITVIVRSSSLAKEVINQIKKVELAFAYVDGLHTFEACSQDIETVSHCKGIIAVDDLSWSRDLRRSITKAAFEHDYQLLSHPYLREGYLYRRQEELSNFLEGPT